MRKHITYTYFYILMTTIHNQTIASGLREALFQMAIQGHGGDLKCANPVAILG